VTYRNKQLRNKLERKVRDLIVDRGFTPRYETESLEYTIPASEHIYTPDFKLSANVYVEAKGIWDLEDRKKILLIQDQYPEVIVCMAFQNASYKINPGSKTTYAMWCEEHGIPYIDTRYEGIPEEWCSPA